MGPTLEAVITDAQLDQLKRDAEVVIQIEAVLRPLSPEQRARCLRALSGYYHFDWKLSP